MEKPDHILELDAVTWSRLVKERDFHRCVMCGSQDELMAKHVIPPERGGRNTLSNGVTLCAEHYHHDLEQDVLNHRKSSTARLNLEIDRTVYLEFRELCKLRGGTVSEKVRTLIGNYLREERGGEPNVT